MLRTALGLTSILLLTACAGNAPVRYDASKDSNVTNTRLELASARGLEMSLPAPKFKPMWLSLAETHAIAPIAEAHEKTQEIASAKISDSELDENRGTFSPEVLNSTVLEATATQNISTNSVTGDNIVNSSAFSNAQGLVNLIQNSGNNVVIQSSTVVNLTFQ